ncbi:MAG: hypothetical protein QXT79_00655, partial [Thermofilaceae archaeon]
KAVAADPMTPASAIHSPGSGLGRPGSGPLEENNEGGDVHQARNKCLAVTLGVEEGSELK